MWFLARLTLVCVIAAGTLAFCQPAPSEEPLASFSGTIRLIDRTSLTIDGPASNALQFFCSRKTRYYEGTARLERSALKPGDRITVDAMRALDGTLTAVTVRREPRNAQEVD